MSRSYLVKKSRGRPCWMQKRGSCLSHCSCQVLAMRWLEGSRCPSGVIGRPWLHRKAIVASTQCFRIRWQRWMTGASPYSRRMGSFLVSSVLGFCPFPVRARDSKRRSELDGYARNVALKGSNLVGIPNQSRLGAVQWPSSTSSNLLCPSRSNNILFCTMPCSIYWCSRSFVLSHVTRWRLWIHRFGQKDVPFRLSIGFLL